LQNRSEYTIKKTKETKHIKIFEDFSGNDLSESGVGMMVYAAKIAKDIMESPDTETGVDILEDFLANMGEDTAGQRETMGAPFGSNGNLMYNTVDVIRNTEDEGLAAQILGDFLKKFKGN
jgi:hypothetical protein